MPIYRVTTHETYSIDYDIEVENLDQLMVVLEDPLLELDDYPKSESDYQSINDRNDWYIYNITDNIDIGYVNEILEEEYDAKI